MRPVLKYKASIGCRRGRMKCLYLWWNCSKELIALSNSSGVLIQYFDILDKEERKTKPVSVIQDPELSTRA